MATLSIFQLPVWDIIIGYLQYLSNYMGSYTLYLVIFVTCIMFLTFVQFIMRRLRLR